MALSPAAIVKAMPTVRAAATTELAQDHHSPITHVPAALQLCGVRTLPALAALGLEGLLAQPPVALQIGVRPLQSRPRAFIAAQSICVRALRCHNSKPSTWDAAMRASRAALVHRHLFVAFASYETQESTAESKMATDVTCNASAVTPWKSAMCPSNSCKRNPTFCCTETTKFCLT